MKKYKILNQIKATFLATIIAIPAILLNMPITTKASNDNNDNALLTEYRAFAANPSAATFDKDLTFTNMKVSLYDNGTKAVVKMPPNMTPTECEAISYEDARNNLISSASIPNGLSNYYFMYYCGNTVSYVFFDNGYTGDFFIYIDENSTPTNGNYIGMSYINGIYKTAENAGVYGRKVNYNSSTGVNLGGTNGSGFKIDLQYYEGFENCYTNIPLFESLEAAKAYYESNDMSGLLNNTSNNGPIQISTAFNESEITELQKIKCLVFDDGITGFDYSGESPLFFPEYVYLPDGFTSYGTGITTGTSNNKINVLAIDGSEHITSISTAAAFSYSNIGEISLTGFTEIPDSFLSYSNVTIDTLNLTNITKIGDNAFFSTSIKNIIGLKPVTIGNNAFYCTKNSSYGDTERNIAIDFSNTKTIGYGAFKNCNITNIGSMSSIKTIDNNAFQNCTFSNTDIDLSNAIFIGESAFSNSNVENVYIPNASIVGMNSSLSAINTDTYTLDSSWVNSSYPDGDLSNNWSQWGSSSSTNKGAFSGCTSLKKLYMPSSLYYNESNLPALTDIWIGDNLINKGTSGFIGAIYENGNYSNTNLNLHTNSELIRDNKTVNIALQNNGVHNDYDTIDTGCQGASGLSSSSGYGNTGKITLIDNTNVTGATSSVSTQYGNGAVQFIAASNLYGLPFTLYQDTSWSYDGFKYSNVVSFPDGLVRAISVPADAGRSAFTTITLNVSNLSETDKNALINSTYGYTKTIYKELEISGSYTVDYASSDDTVKASLSDIKTTSTKQISGDYNTGTKIGHYITFDVPAGVDATNIGSCQLYHKNTEGTFEIVTNIAKDISDSKVKIYSPDVEFEIGTYAFTSGDIANSYDVVTVHEYNNTELNRTSEQISYNSNKTITNSDVRMTGYKLDSISYVTNNGTPTTAIVGTPFKILGNTTITIKYIKSPTVTLKCVDNDGNQIHSETKDTYAYSSTQYRYDFEETPDIEGYIYDENASYVNSNGDTITLEIDDSVYMTSDITITLVYKKLPKVTRIDKYEDTILGSESDIDVDYDGSYYFSPAIYTGYEFISASYQENGTTKSLTSSQWIYPDRDITIITIYKKIKSATIIDMYGDTELGRRTIYATSVPQGDRINFTTQTYSGYYVISATYTLNDGTECGAISTGYNYITEDIIITVQYDVCPVIKFVEILDGVETLKSTVTATSTSYSYTPQPRDGYYVDDTFIVNDNTSVVLNYDSYYPTIIVTNYDTKDITIKYTYVQTTNIILTVIDRNCITGEDIIRSGYNALSTTSGNLVRAMAYWPNSNYRPYKVTITNDAGNEKSFEATLSNQYLPVRATENCTIVYEYRTFPELKVLHKVGTTTVEESSSYRQISGGYGTSYYLSDSELSAYGYSNYVLTNIVINSAQADTNCFEILQAGPDADKNKMVRVGNTQPLWEDATITFYYEENCEWKLDSIAITTPPTKTIYTEGDPFDKTGMVVTGTYHKFVNNIDTGIIDNKIITDYTVNKTVLQLRDTNVIVSYEGKTTTQNITVNERPVYYTVKYYDTDNITILKSESVLKNTSSTAPTEPTKEPITTDKFSVFYTFDKWIDSNDNDVDLMHISNNISVYPSFTETKELYITFYKTDNTPLKTDTITVGGSVTAPIVNKPLEKTDDYDIDYTFSKWINSAGADAIFNNIQEGDFYYPVFTDKKYCTVKFFDDDKSTLLKEDRIEIGASVAAPITKPNNYTFDKWINMKDNKPVTLTVINKNLSVYASYTITAIRKVTIEGILKNSNGQPIANKIIELHSTPRTTITDTQGYYKFNDVEIGEHTLTIKNTDESNYAIIKLNISNDTAKNDKYNIIASANNCKTEIITNNDLIKTATVVEIINQDNKDTDNSDDTVDADVSFPTIPETIINKNINTQITEKPLDTNNPEKPDNMINTPNTGDNRPYAVPIYIIIDLICIIIIFVSLISKKHKK